MNEDAGTENQNLPKAPSANDRMPVHQLAAPHPSVLHVEQLLAQCELRTQRRSGPGGQHRNKTSSGAFLAHRPTGMVAEATERRSQAENREVALSRLRLRMATELRTASILDSAMADDADRNRSVDDTAMADPTQTLCPEQTLREQFLGTGLKIGIRNPTRPGVLALVLNDLHAAGGQPSLCGSLWLTTTSDVIRFVKLHAPAFTLLNAIRAHHGRRPLK